MSRIVQLTRPGGPDLLEFKDIDISAPPDDEVRIQVKAIGINRAESMWREDAYIEPIQFPARLGHDEAVGRSAGTLPKSRSAML